MRCLLTVLCFLFCSSPSLAMAAPPTAGAAANVTPESKMAVAVAAYDAMRHAPFTRYLDQVEETLACVLIARTQRPLEPTLCAIEGSLMIEKEMYKLQNPSLVTSSDAPPTAPDASVSGQGDAANPERQRALRAIADARSLIVEALTFDKDNMAAHVGFGEALYLSALMEDDAVQRKAFLAAAEAHARDAVLRDKSSVSANYLLASVFLAQQKPGRAKPYADLIASTLDSKMASVFVLQGEILAAMNRPVDAKASLAKARAIDPTLAVNPPPRLSPPKEAKP